MMGCSPGSQGICGWLVWMICELKAATQGSEGSAFGPFGKEGCLASRITLREHNEESNL